MHATETVPKNADDVLRAAEACLAVDHPDHSSEMCRRHVHELIVGSAREFVRTGRTGEAFKLISSVRLEAAANDRWSTDLFRLRNTLLRYEQCRIVHLRRWLAYVLLGVLAYLFFISPSVFVALENPYRIAHQMSELDWSEGLYWSVVTSTTVGYGDVVPYTPFGRMFALFDALLGVLLMSVTAGLILSLLTPRRLD